METGSFAAGPKARKRSMQGRRDGMILQTGGFFYNSKDVGHINLLYNHEAVIYAMTSIYPMRCRRICYSLTDQLRLLSTGHILSIGMAYRQCHHPFDPALGSQYAKSYLLGPRMAMTSPEMQRWKLENGDQYSLCHPVIALWLFRKYMSASPSSLLSEQQPS